MGKINVLSFEVANLIAAGEVVDRPASVIKELMENSIDAGAKKITVEIKNGGVSYMRVSDDGCGMAPEDMPLALKRHATSKIATADDLAAIFTLGFRGEALAAISSVSKVRILSKTAEAANGAILCADGGRIVSVGEAGCPAGTTITVEELFSNVPARRKFLKKDATEAAAVAVSVEKIALSHPEIAVRLITDGNIKLDTAGDGKPENAIYAVLGRNFAQRMLPVKCRSEGVEVHGFIGTPDNVRPTRNFQNFFINNRYVKSRTAMAAIEQAFSSYIAPERFPACVLFIDVNPAAVDVNVHPAKLEVKFSNEKIIFDTVYYAVRNALEKNTDRPDLVLRSDPVRETHTSTAFVPVMDRFSYLAAMPEQGRIDRMGGISFGNDARHAPTTAHAPENAPSTMQQTERTAPRFAPKGFGEDTAVCSTYAPAYREPMPPAETPTQMPTSEQPPRAPLPTDADVPAAPRADRAAPAAEIPTIESLVPDIVAETLPLPEYKIVGIAFNTYIFVETENKLVVIDKHAAHERILFEDMRLKLRGAAPTPQILLVPIVLDLPQSDFSALCDYRDEFGAIGFAFDLDEAEHRVKLLQIPSAPDATAAADLVTVTADLLASGAGDIEVARRDAYERALYQASCKAAMKGGRVDSESDVRFVVEKVLTTPSLTVCPHGRPVVTNLTKYALDKQFGRV